MRETLVLRGIMQCLPAVAEVLAVLRRVGILDVFTESGKMADIKQKYKLTAEQVALQYADAAK